MTLDPAGLEAAAKLARSCTPTAREDARLAEQIVRAYLAAAPDTGRSVLMHVPVTPTTENPPENVYARLRNRPPEPSAAVAWDEGYVAGFAAGRAAATSDQPEPCEKCRVWSSHCPRCAAATPDPPDMTNMCEGESPDHKPGITPAASPDERLREAAGALVVAAACAVCEPGPFHDNDDHLQWKLADAITATRAALAAADREKLERICCRGMGADGGCNICAAEATR